MFETLARRYCVLHILLLFSLFYSCSIETIGDNSDNEENEFSEGDNSDNEENEFSEPETYFTLVVNERFKTDVTDDFLIIHDSEGEFLEYKPFEAGETLVFSASLDTLTEQISITTLRYVQYESLEKAFTLKTMANIDVGATEDIGTDYSPNPLEDSVADGEFNLSIEEIPAGYNTPFGYGILNTFQKGLIGGSGSGSGFGSSFNQDFDLTSFANYDEYFITILDGNGELKYFNFTRPEPGFNLYTRYSDGFKYFDNYIDINLPEGTKFNLNVAAFEDDQDFNQREGYWFHDIINGAFLTNFDTPIPTNPLKIGFLDRFNKYRIFFSAFFDEYSYSLIHYGVKPNTIQIIDQPSVIYQSATPNLISLQTDMDYKIASHHFRTNTGSTQENNFVSRNWYVYLNKEQEFKQKNWPKELSDLYPDFTIDVMEYQSGSFYFRFDDIDGDSTPYLDSNTYSSKEFVKIPF